jgi:hypothetical protein
MAMPAAALQLVISPKGGPPYPTPEVASWFTEATFTLLEACSNHEPTVQHLNMSLITARQSGPTLPGQRGLSSTAAPPAA